jgi:hypothetical protein
VLAHTVAISCAYVCPYAVATSLATLDSCYYYRAPLLSLTHGQHFGYTRTGMWREAVDTLAAMPNTSVHAYAAAMSACGKVSTT